MLKQSLMVSALLALTACAQLQPQTAPPELSREGEMHIDMRTLQNQLIAGTPLSPEQISDFEARLAAASDTLATADFNWLAGMHHFLIMRADNADVSNLAAATRRLTTARAIYADLQEPWLEAKATMLLAIAHARAGQYREVCSYYDETVTLLQKGPGQLADFDYDQQTFSTPEEYVAGMFGDTCAVLRHDPGRHNFDEHGNMKILKRRAAAE